ncbi:hypothetical protein BSK56_17660 [Paenibacillus borealis]|uniref:Uncharacterized protein n=1 Tax=Paenibacillus borealis TaxID=160799 RepID=A0ABX3H8T8_PAEBO|nr:hypothetical protein BSK56_17660 [Paenibacillus borealis]
MFITANSTKIQYTPFLFQMHKRKLFLNFEWFKKGGGLWLFGIQDQLKITHEVLRSEQSDSSETK